MENRDKVTIDTDDTAEPKVCVHCKSKRLISVRKDSDWGYGGYLGRVNDDKYYMPIDPSSMDEFDIFYFHCLECASDDPFSEAQARTKQETRVAVLEAVRSGLPEKNSHTEKWQLSNGKQEVVHIEDKYDDFNRAIDAVNELLTRMEGMK